MADGGEGTVDAFLSALGGERKTVRVHGPLFAMHNASFGILKDGTAILEMAAAAGLPLAGKDANPMYTTTFGVGELIRAALDAGAMDAAEAQCIDLSDENGFFSWLLNFLFGWLGKSDTEPVYSGWRTSGGKTYYYSQTTNKPVTGIQCIDNKLYYFNADGVLENGKTFGVDVSKYQKNIDWNQIKKAGVSFVIVRIGYRGYGASGTLVLDPMFEEHFTNVKNAGLKVGVYFFSQATTEEEAKEEAFACAYVLNGRKLDYPIFFDTEASGASNGSGRADGLGMEDRTKCAIAFCEEVKAQGYKPGVYASTLWYRKRVNLNSLKKYTIWNCLLYTSPSPRDCS